MSKPWMLGISASHNGAVCLLEGDEIVVAIQEERLSRIKRDRNYGAYDSLALEYCFDYKDWTPVVVQFINAFQLELQEKLIKPFAMWAKFMKGFDLESLFPQERDYRIPLRRISSFLNALDAEQQSVEDGDRYPNPELHSKLLRDFAGMFPDKAAIEFLNELRKRLAFIVAAFDDGLRAELLPRDKAIEFLDELVMLLHRFSYAAQALRRPGSA